MMIKSKTTKEKDWQKKKERKKKQKEGSVLVVGQLQQLDSLHKIDNELPI